jgi:hypothetical protein
MREKRRFIRTKLRRLTCIVKSPSGEYKLLVEQQKKNPTLIDVKDISTGGIRIESKYELMKGASLELTIPKLKTIDSTVLKCEVTRAQYIDGTGEYIIGLRFIPPNTDYLKQFVAAIQA